MVLWLYVFTNLIAAAGALYVSMDVTSSVRNVLQVLALITASTATVIVYALIRSDLIVRSRGT